MTYDPIYDRMMLVITAEEWRALITRSKVLREYAQETVATSRRIRRRSAAIAEHNAEIRRNVAEPKGVVLAPAG